MYEIRKGYIVYNNGQVNFGTIQYHEGTNEVTINGKRKQIGDNTPIFCGTAERAAEYLRQLAKIKFQHIDQLSREADTCQGNAVHLERTIAGQ